jgi:hypothetical protein
LRHAEGVLKQSDSESYLWARKAANKGMAKAEYAVGCESDAPFRLPRDDADLSAHSRLHRARYWHAGRPRDGQALVHARGRSAE